MHVIKMRVLQNCHKWVFKRVLEAIIQFANYKNNNVVIKCDITDIFIK